MSCSGEKCLDAYRRYCELDSGGRARIKRVSSPDELRDVASFFRVLPDDVERSEIRGWTRVVFLFPLFEHSENAPSLGKILSNASVTERKISIIGRSGYPRNMEYLRKALRLAKSRGFNCVNWKELGQALFYWGPKEFRSLVFDFCIEEKKRFDTADLTGTTETVTDPSANDSENQDK